MKLSRWAKQNNITYRTAWNMYKNGLLKDIAYELPSGAIFVREEKNIQKEEKIITYARVSSSENKDNLEKQSQRLQDYCFAKGYKIYKNVKEIGSGLNDNRKQLESILKDSSITKIVVEHKDRFSRFGNNYIEILLKLQGREIEYINCTQNDKEDLIQDFVSIITSFTSRLYGLRRSKRKTEKLIRELNENK
jgi:predicted site-specific integrase-resolvase